MESLGKRQKLAIISVALIAGGWYGATMYAADVVPKRTEFTRYQMMLDHSPFAVATAAALPAATQSFAKDLYIANAARSPEGDLVTLASASDKNFKEYLSTKEPNLHGYSVANIEWSERVGATKVTISKDGQFATVSFNQALLAAPAGAQMSAPAPNPGFVQPAPPVQQGQPNVIYAQGQPTPGVARPAVPTVAMPTPPPRTRGVIQRNPSAAVPRVPAAAPTPAVVPQDDAEDE